MYFYSYQDLLLPTNPKKTSLLLRWIKNQTHQLPQFQESQLPNQNPRRLRYRLQSSLWWLIDRTHFQNIVKRIKTKLDWTLWTDNKFFYPPAEIKNQKRQSITLPPLRHPSRIIILLNSLIRRYPPHENQRLQMRPPKTHDQQLIRPHKHGSKIPKRPSKSFLSKRRLRSTTLRLVNLQ